MKVTKRDGRIVDFDSNKIAAAIRKASGSVSEFEQIGETSILDITQYVSNLCELKSNLTVEGIQDLVEMALMEYGYYKVARNYITYRYKHNVSRSLDSRLMEIYKDLTFVDAKDNNIKRENANIDGDTAMGTMLKYGSEGAKQFYETVIINPKQSQAHVNGDIHIHDLDFYALTTTCCQIDLTKLFKDGFSTGHGFLREPNSIQSYSALACIAIQSNQNDQHGGQSVPSFDHDMTEGVKKSYAKMYKDNFAKYFEIVGKDPALAISMVDSIKKDYNLTPSMDENNGYHVHESSSLIPLIGSDLYFKAKAFARKYADKEIDRATYQAMEAMIHNLNTMHSRAGAQVPFSSINFGTDTSIEGRLVIKNMLLALDAGLGNGETPIFPIFIFKVKEGVNFNPEDPSYDMFKLAMKVSAKRLFPNFSFLDAPFNIPYYKPGQFETEVTYMGCRTRVIGNVYDPDRQIVNGRGNLSFTSINLPRLGIKAKGDLNKFYEMLDEKMNLVIEQLADRFKIQCRKKVKNYPFLMGQGIWLDSDKLGPEDSVAEVLKHGTLSVGFIGLAECLTALIGKHHGESEEAQKLGLEIITRMRKRCDEESQKTKLNYTLLATPAESLSGRFVRLDKKLYGEIPGVTDKEYYTNSFHIPVRYNISAFEKIRLEAPYHALTNAGHISYIELDGDPLKNLDAFEAIIRYMKECGIGYGSINHPVDRDPVCGYTGIIDEVCPRCGRHDGEGVSIEKLQKLGLYKHLNSSSCGYCGNPDEEADRNKHSNTI